ncbi:MAG: sigma-70 family RNA polymerase sigma factor [Acidimicrobiia bacterium]|nr:sigma-70 family RNA polymerase sigma factor [Acidimicrobiia bacterium]
MRQDEGDAGQEQGVSIESDRRTRFESIVVEVAEPVQRFLRRRANADDADDAYSETLLAIWRRLDDVPTDAVLPWTYGVARRVLGNQRRAEGRRLRLVERVGSSEPDPLIEGPDVDTHPEVRDALDRLPAADREVLTLWAWEELEPREIALVLDTTANAISLRLSRARSKLADELRRQDAGRAGQEQGERPEGR